MSYYNRFYRSHGIRRVQHLQTPPINDAVTLSLPRDSVFHYLPETNLIKGIPADHWAVKDSDRLVMVEHVQELAVREGSPRKAPAGGEREIRDYHRRFRRHKLVRDLARDTRDDRTPLVINYALLPELYRYTQSLYSQHYRDVNLLGTLWANMESYVKKVPQRQHFVEFHLPDIIPALSDFKKAEEELGRPQMDTFNSFESLMVLDIWRWLGKERGAGSIGQLSETTLPQVNLIIRRDNKWVMMNLGRLDEWRKGMDDEDGGDIGPDALQKRFLRLLMELFESTTPVTQKDDAQILVEQETKKKDDSNRQAGISNKTEEQEDDDKESAKKQLKESSVEEDGDLERELDALREVAQKELEEAEDDPFLEEDADGEIDYGRGIMERAETLAAEGIISAAEYKRYERIAENQRELRNPYTGKGSIKETTVVTPEDVAIEAPTKLMDSDGVIDKSMLETTLQDFDRRYVKNVLPKDTVNCVMGITNAGVAVTDYDVERVEDVANEYEIHTVKLNPVRGKSSTIRFKLPVVNSDGTYVANGIEYRLRKQRVDVPIRKVKENKVALTSYYGKVFVERSTKVVHDYGKWLTKSIRQIGLDGEDGRVINLKSAKSVRDDLKAPRLYTVLGHEFLSFTAAEIDFYLSYDKRVEHFGAETVKEVEKDNLVMIGRKARTPVVVDTEDTLYLVKSNGLDVIGKIEDVIGLDRNKAPVDVAELKIFSKTIPMGVALAYYTGLKKLVDNLPGTVKRVGSGERFSLSDDEFTVRFEDETLIVSREDKITALILGGFNNYKKSIKRYSVHDFNKKDVYLNVLAEHGLSNRHLNELDLMEDMFIDPITKEILQEMKEPTTWLPLLRRAIELLLSDYSPSETELAFMRIRGYERLAGAVYAELVNSMRDYMVREGTGNASIDMKPFAVWQAINEDNSKVQVEGSNPIKNVNEGEAVTFMGSGGRGRTSMVARTRIYGESDMGTISEATVDSGDVAINTYTTANPKFTSLRGLTSRYDGKNAGPASLLSTGALISPAADTDDPKRVS